MGEEEFVDFSSKCITLNSVVLVKNLTVLKNEGFYMKFLQVNSQTENKIN